MIEMHGAGASQAIALLTSKITEIEDMRSRLEKASDHIYELTRQRFDEQGEGQWPPLAESTVAKKASQGYAEPERILYAEGNLYESASSPNGPYSQRLFIEQDGKSMVVMLVDWEVGGWQIPVVLDEGNDRLPPRPIWPESSPQLQFDIARILLR